MAAESGSMHCWSQPHQSSTIYTVTSARRRKKPSTIFCSQFDVNEWHASLYDPTMADAICDRIVYNAHTIKIEGDSMRKRAAIAE